MLLFGTLGLLWLILCRDLSLEWSSNDQYSYGWFVPVFAAFLFWLRFENWTGAGDKRLENRGPRSENGEMTSGPSQPQKLGPDSARPSGHLSPVLYLLSSLLLLFLLLPVRLFEVANPDWRPLSWVHALAVVGLTLLVILYGAGEPALRNFAFPVCFILVAVPWLTPIEAPLVRGLMNLVAAIATEMLTLFGIPAQLEGSLIQVHTGVVGVSEACSGVRSLQTSLMIGLLFGELKPLTIVSRVGLVGAALAIALFANFARAFFLVWIAATRSLAAVEDWHDIAGYAIVGAVFLGTIALSSALARGQKSEVRNQKSAVRSQRTAIMVENRLPTPDLRSPISALRFPRFPFLLSAFLYVLLVEIAVDGWYRWHERNLVPAKQWTVRWPENVPGFRELPIDEHTRESLRYDAGREVSWTFSQLVRPESPDAPSAPASERSATAFLYFFRWEPGTATVLRARAHRPDICLPYVGWRQVGEPASRAYTVSENFSLPFRHFSFSHDHAGNRPLYAETFFCLREDRVQPETRSGTDESAIPFSSWSIPERWDLVRKGSRNPGQQMLEFVLLTRQAPIAAEAETEFARLVPQLVKLSNQESKN